jgi:hypothetical protein
MIPPRGRVAKDAAGIFTGYLKFSEVYPAFCCWRESSLPQAGDGRS